MIIEEHVRDALQQAPPMTGPDLDTVISRGQRRRRMQVAVRTAAGTSALAAASVGLVLALQGGENRATPQPPTQVGTQYKQPTTPEEYQRDLGLWADCLRTHGVPVPTPTGWPDDEFDAALPKGDPVYEAASDKCSDLLPTITAPLEKAWGQTSRPLSDEMLARERVYADCMHDNGFLAYPEPRRHGITEDEGQDLQAAFATPEGERALKACGPLNLGPSN